MRSRRPALRGATRPVLLLAAVNLVTLGSLAAPVLAGIPLKLDALLPEGQRAAALATVLAAGAVAALVANPLFGALSDRTRGRFGRRRPWMLGGALSGLACVALLAVADSVAMILISWVGAQVAFNATMAGSAALLADSVSDRQRASASGLFTAAAFVGTLPPLALAALFPQSVDAISLIMPAAAVVVVGIAMTLPDRMPRAGADERTPDADADERRMPQADADDRARGAGPRGRLPLGVPGAFAAVWLQRFAMQAAFSLTAAFTLYLVIDRMTGDAIAATPVAMVATVAGGAGIVAGAAVGGAWASRRGGYLPFFVFAGLGLAAAAALRAVVETPLLLWVAAVIGGIAVGVSLAVNLALAMRVTPTQREGTYLGVLNVAETLPQVFVPLLAAALLRVGAGDPVSGAGDNYTALYAVAALIAVLSLLTLPLLGRAARSPERARTPEPAQV